MRTIIAQSLLAVVLTLGPACAGALPIIATITSIAAEAVTWVDVISDFVSRSPIDEATRAKIDQAVHRARLAAITLQRAGRGADELSREQLEAAFASFREAYEALLAVTEPFGVREALPAGAFGVDIDGRLQVPAAETFGLPR